MNLSGSNIYYFDEKKNTKSSISSVNFEQIFFC